MTGRGPRTVRVAALWGTVVSIHVIGDVATAAIDEAAERIFADFRAVDARFSPWHSGSELSRMRRGDGGSISTDMRAVIEGCASAASATRGRFDAGHGARFDPLGYVKGWAVERAAEQHLRPLLDLDGAIAAGINAGGDMQLMTAPGAEWVWRVGIADPAVAGSITGQVEVVDGAVATSGLAERGRHIVDPSTGLPVDGVSSATVIADSLTDADVWATAAVVAGMDDLSWIRDAPVRGGLLVAPDGHVRRWVRGIEVATVHQPIAA